MDLMLFGTKPLTGGEPIPIAGIDLDNAEFPGLGGIATINFLLTGSGLYLPQTGQASGGGAMLSSSPNPATGLLAGTTGLTTAAAQLPSHVCRSALLYNDATSGIVILIGGSTSQPIKLQPGDSWAADVINLNLFWAKSASGTPSLAWLVLT